MSNVETPLEFAEKISQSLGLKPEEVDDLFNIDEDRDGYFVASLYPKKFLNKEQFKMMCALVKDLKGEGYLQGAKSWKIMGPMAKKSPTVLPSDLPTEKSVPTTVSTAVPTTVSTESSQPLVLKVNPKYDAILPRLSKEEFDALKTSIKDEGQHFSIIINEDSEILDGHHRYRICQELGIEPKVEKRIFSDKLVEKKFVIEANLWRRQLNDFEKAEFGLLLMEIENEHAKQRQLAGVSIKVQETLSSNELKVSGGQARDIVARQISLSPTTFQRALVVMEKASPELKNRLRNNDLSIGGAYKQVQEAEARANHIKLLNEKELCLPNNVSLYNGDFTEKTLELTPESIQLILTDPPYGEAYLDLWDKLAETASRLLVPGGFLITYSGQLHLPIVLNKLSSRLQYFWTLALHLKERNLVNSRNIYNKWKPLLVFYKSPLQLPITYVEDTLNGLGREKEYHDWQQAEKEIEFLIEAFCPEQGIVLDPMAGTGTTLLVALKLKRKCIGIELETETFELMKRRLSNATTEN